MLEIANTISVVLGLWIGIIYANNLARQDIFIDSKRLAKKAPSLIFLLVATMLLLGFHLFLARFKHINYQMPLSFQAYFPPIFGILVHLSVGIFCGTFFASASVSQSPLRKRIRYYVLLAVLCFELVDYPINQLKLSSMQHIENEEGVILQSTSATCAAASLANVLNEAFEYRTTEKEMAEKLGTDHDGTSDSQVIRTLWKLGFEISVSMDREKRISSVATPALLAIDHPDTGPNSHMVSLMSVNENEAEIWDPLFGKQHFTIHHVKDFWGGISYEIRRPL